MGSKVKYIALAAVVLTLGVVIYGKMFPGDSSQDLTGIKAEFIGEVEPGGRYSRNMFDVRGVTTSGRMVKIDDFDVYDPAAEVDEETGERPPLRAGSHGETCEVVIEAKGFSDTVTVTLTREATASKNIGYPTEEDATVTCYANGDLVFTGKGQVMNFGDTPPWEDCEYSHVYIDEALEVETMDGWFKGNEELVYCDSLPKTVKTMKETFSGCTQLEKAPEYFQCSELQIMDYAFSGCKSLKEVDVIPVSVSSTQFTFEGCTALQNPASLDKTSNLTNVTGMYSGCSSLREATPIPETVTAMDKVYMGCLNIKEPVKFPSNVQTISEAYSGCASMMTGTTVPESVSNMQKCFYGCSSLSGTLEINSDTDEFSGMFQGATTNGDHLALFGNSGNLLAIQKDSGNSSISLNDPAAAALQNERMIRERAALGGAGY